MSQAPMSRQTRSRESRAAEVLLARTARMLHACGASADQLESSIAQLADRLGVQVCVFSTPTVLQLAYGPEGDQRMSVYRVSPPAVDLGKLARLQDALAGLDRSTDPFEQVSRAIATIDTAEPTFGPRLITLAFGMASATFCGLLGGALMDIVFSALAGLAIGVASVTSAARRLGHALDPVAAACAAFATLALGPAFAVDTDLVTLSALIALVPGFTLTVAMSELAERHLVSGTARLASAGISFLSIAFGVAIGRELAGRLPQQWSELRWIETIALPAWAEWLALFAAPLAFVVLFQARRRDTGWILLASLAAFAGSRGGTAVLGPELGVCVGSLTLGLSSNLIARLRAQPSAITTVPALMLLVPGSLGYKSLELFLSDDVLFGIETAFRMILVAVSLVIGLLVANRIARPRGVVLPSSATRSSSASSEQSRAVDARGAGRTLRADRRGREERDLVGGIGRRQPLRRRGRPVPAECHGR